MAEYVRHLPNDVIVVVDKVGGGTPWRLYEGDWEVRVIRNDSVILDDVITTGTPKTHSEVADLAEDFADDADEV